MKDKIRYINERNNWYTAISIAASKCNGETFSPLKNKYVGKSVVVCAPTGAGKTVIAQHAIHCALEKNQRVFYTTPLKALSNDKVREFQKIYGEENIGLITGDKKITITSDTGNRKIICHDEKSLLKVEGKDSGVILQNVEIDGLKVERDKSLIKVDGGILTLNAGAEVHHCRCTAKYEEYEEDVEDVDDAERGHGGVIYCSNRGKVDNYFHDIIIHIGDNFYQNMHMPLLLELQ